MPTHEQIQATFERVLSDLGLDPATCREGDGWWRFYPDDLPFQGGIHPHEFQISCALCEIDSDADIDAVWSDIKKRNSALTDPLASFTERDNYLWVISRSSLHGLDQAHLRAMIDACIALARSDAASALRSSYRQW
ncbi:MAG TPA: hypothetical protein VIK91_10610 [Nannocystis sp.]